MTNPVRLTGASKTSLSCRTRVVTDRLPVCAALGMSLYFNWCKCEHFTAEFSNSINNSDLIP